jgi:hypothetical protein
MFMFHIELGQCANVSDAENVSLMTRNRLYSVSDGFIWILILCQDKSCFLNGVLVKEE